jgi:hypothetical protein
MSLARAWRDILKKEATGIDDCDLGKVQQIGTDFIVTEKGIINKKRYCIPKNLIAGFDGHTLYFRIMKAESKRFRRDDLKKLKRRPLNSKPNL